MEKTGKKKLLILGGGYGGVLVAQGMSKLVNKLDIEVTLINKHSYHQMITRLHEPAGSELDSEDVRIPLDHLIKSNVKLVKGWVDRIDAENKCVVYKDSPQAAEENIQNYDYLVIGLGSDPEYFGIPGLQENSFTLHSLNAARLIKAKIEICLARHKTAPDDESYLNFVVGGAGFTGVELAGELAEWLPQVAPKYDVPLEKIRLICAEAAPVVMPGFDELLSAKVADILRAKGVELILGTPVKEVTEDYVLIGEEKIPTKTMIWTGGVRGNSVLERSCFKCQRGRANINEYLQSINSDDVFIIGDSSIFFEENGRPLPPTAQLAMQQGKHLVTNLKNYIQGQEMRPFKFINRGVVASVGPKAAVGLVYGKYRIDGMVAVYMKKIVHYRYLFYMGGPSLMFKGFFGLLPETRVSAAKKLVARNHR